MIRLLTLLIALSCAPAFAAGQQDDKVSPKLWGAWRLVSVQGTDPILNLKYKNPTGIIMYDPSGWMSVQIAIQGERKPFSKGPGLGALEEKANAFDSFGSYYGTYTVDVKAQTIKHLIKDSSFPGRTGVSNSRWFEFDGDDRIMLTPMEDGKGGVVNRKKATYKLIWEA